MLLELVLALEAPSEFVDLVVEVRIEAPGVTVSAMSVGDGRGSC